ncbi:MAG: N-acetyl-gamma-glutamyl-phosphate reductase [Ruminococcaceae bacterium]|nr:N-acetyl-gamma-glutamyl-phosphate reductase [Oscillospiraceae bacterium]
MKKVFIDGSAGTTGLRIHERLSARDDISVITLSDEKRKDPLCRKEAINSADIAFLCLPDDAAREAVSFIENENTVVIDTSTAHRTEPYWAYGFPELSEEHLEKIKSSKRIAVPGCHASGFIALVYPLVEKGVLSPETLLSCFSLTGYSGGGKKMIGEYENGDRDVLLDAPRIYGLTQTHKHLKEMKAVTGINEFPVFMPVVAPFYSGMAVSIPLFASQVSADINEIRKIYEEKYTWGMVSFKENIAENGFLSAGTFSCKDTMTVGVYGNGERFTLEAVYDNLGKGASGAAIECMNIVLGNAPSSGLTE